MQRLALVKQALERAPRGSEQALHDIVSPFPLQRPRFYYPGLDTAAFHDKGQHPWAGLLDDAYPAIRADLDQLIRDRNGFIRVFEQDTAEGEWGAFILHLYGRELHENTARCPNTMAVLNSIPGLCGLVCFSALAPKTHILPHCGPSNVRLRCHLPLKVPPECRLRVADETVEWTPGESIIFDDSFEHEAWNMSTEPRYVLMLDLLHPNLTREEQEFCYAVQENEAKEAYARLLLERAEPSGAWVYGQC